LIGTDEPEELHQKGKDGKCTVEYEDIYIGGELSHSVRIEDSIVVIKAPVNEITLYGTQSVIASGEMIWPTVGWVTSEYGKRKAEFAGMSTYHRGIDISTSRKTKIVAADAGVVEFAGWHSGGFGYCVIIDHENGVKTLYAHMYTKPLVKEGERVFKGEHLGGQGMTGSAGGIHLHFEVIENGERINPRKYLPKGYPPTEW
jgi:murein DD-endopeptidase MepM/ murein hydrolase activator NlpD